MKTRPRWTVELTIIFSGIVLTFLAATTFSHWRLRALDRASLEIADNAAPSIERLAAGRAEMLRLQILLREYLDRRTVGAPGDAEAIELSRRSMAQEIDVYLTLPLFPGERDRWAAILRGRDALNKASTLCISEADRGELQAARAALQGDVAGAANDLDAAITQTIEFDAMHARDLALRIKDLRTRSTSTAFALDAACVLVTLAGAIALRRAMRAHTELVERHRLLLEERASELEQFAGTVAHDILSPLGIVSLSLDLAGRSCAEESRARFVARGVAALERVRRLVHDLLEFARAGAKPDPGARADVGRTIADLVESLTPDATNAGVKISAKAVDTSDVVCNAGILMSLVGNLARNAIKYVGDGPARRIEIRALDREGKVRVEVQDTGPGLPPDLEQRVFEPYVRGTRATQPGIGLGLATVKRLAEAHGGTCGVRSVPGEGCTFWFELPAAARQDLVTAAVSPRVA